MLGSIRLIFQDIQITAFNWENGHYEYWRMSFALKNATATFQRVMYNILGGSQNETCAVYLHKNILGDYDQFSKDTESWTANQNFCEKMLRT